MSQSSTPIFFLSVPTFMALCGKPKITGLLRLMEVERGVALPLDKKTVRNIFKAGAKPSKKTESKFMGWMETAIGASQFQNMLDHVEQYHGRRKGEVEWRSLLHGWSGGTEYKLYPKTVTYIVELLDMENAFFNDVHAFAECDDTYQKLEVLLTGGYFLKYGLKVEKNTIADLVNKHDGSFEACMKEPQIEQAVLYGVINLHMDILARAEVEWFEENNHLLPEEKHFKGYVTKILPSFESGESSFPIYRFFDLFKSLLKLNAWKDLAVFVKMEGAADLEDKRRKLHGWLDGSHYPDAKVVSEMLHAAAKPHGDYDLSYFEDLYAVAVFLNRFLQEMQKEVRKGRLETDLCEQAFSTYQEHFDRHKKNVMTKLG